MIGNKTPTLADQFTGLRQQRSIVAILLFLLVAVVFWVGVSLFSSQQKFAVPKEMRDLARPLSPILDRDIFTRISQKRDFSAQELENFTIYKVVINDLAKQFRLVDITYQEVQTDTLAPAAVISPPAPATSSASTAPATEETPVASGASEVNSTAPATESL